jgi:hypothetical protein
MTLTAGMYSDLNCKKFGISYNQQRISSIATNAGWFNSKGERIGMGDLSMEDIFNISIGIENSESFYILSEVDHSWNLPSHLNATSPGIDYVYDKAIWAIIKNQPLKIVNDLEVNERVVFDSKCTYYEVSRDNLKSKTTKDTDLSDVNIYDISPKVYYGMDVYHCKAGGSYAIGNSVQSFDAASNKIESTLWQSNIDDISKFSGATATDIILLTELIFYHSTSANNIIKLVLGKALNEYITYVIGKLSLGTILATYDGVELVSDRISGLPPGFWAYRVSV